MCVWGGGVSYLLVSLSVPILYNRMSVCTVIVITYFILKWMFVGVGICGSGCL